jgi:hypothetical protein
LRRLLSVAMVALGLVLANGQGVAKGKRKAVIVDNYLPRVLTDLAGMVGTWDGIDPQSNRLFRIEVEKNGHAVLLSGEESYQFWLSTLRRSRFSDGEARLEFAYDRVVVTVVGQARAAKEPSLYGEFRAHIKYASDLDPIGTSWSIRFVRFSDSKCPSYFNWIGRNDEKMREAIQNSRGGSSK